MLNAKLTWNGDKAIAEVRAASWDGVRRAAAFLFTKIVEALNVSNPRGRWPHPYPNPSKPGEPPRKRTGFLQRNVAYELDEAQGVARVGVRANAKYGAFLELGTARMKPRPFIVATLKKFWATIKSLAEAG